MHKPYVSIIIPTFNEAKNIGPLLDGIREVMEGYAYEVIVVDKHSPDGTASIAAGKGTKVFYDDNGKGSALKLGFKKASGEIIVSMDADLSHRPLELKLLIAGVEAGYDICMGSRFLIGGGSDDLPLYRRFGNKAFVMLVNALYGAHYSDLCYGYRSFRKNTIKSLGLKSDGFGIETEINIKAVKANLRVIEVPSYEKKRSAGEGKLRSLRDGYVILKTILLNLK
ncbi:glycosyltransferase family 2 protein [Candidatus Marsarchaeota archaeon]|nr:glycosyltransferase family 2 protein [Candidatus Marsarchaeota archaeon]MCL5404979.1 glycosyltransferase family 2 protein [Candidatus Marsarchaeota archaeon]